MSEREHPLACLAGKSPCGRLRHGPCPVTARTEPAASGFAAPDRAPGSPVARWDTDTAGAAPGTCRRARGGMGRAQIQHRRSTGQALGLRAAGTVRPSRRFWRRAPQGSPRVLPAPHGAPGDTWHRLQAARLDKVRPFSYLSLGFTIIVPSGGWPWVRCWCSTSTRPCSTRCARPAVRRGVPPQRRTAGVVRLGAACRAQRDGHRRV